MASSGGGAQCPGCGEDAVVYEDKEAQRVCTACGLVLDQGGLVTDVLLGDGNSANFSSLPSEFYNRNTPKATRDPDGKVLGTRMIHDLASVMSFNPTMIEEAVGLFHQAYALKNIHDRLIHNKQTVASACVYIVARQQGWPVTVKQVASLAQRTVPEICHWKNCVITSLGLVISRPDIAEVVPGVCSKWLLGEEVMDLTVEIIQLAKEVWLDQGRDNEKLIVAAAFIAFKAVNGVSRKEIHNLKAFCRMVKIKHSAIFGHRLQELLRLLNCLAKGVPWILTEININNVSQYLKDIIQFQKSLLFEAAEKFNSTDSEENHTSDNLGKSDMPANNPIIDTGVEEKSVKTLCENEEGNLGNTVLKQPNSMCDDDEGKSTKIISETEEGNCSKAELKRKLSLENSTENDKEQNQKAKIMKQTSSFVYSFRKPPDWQEGDINPTECQEVPEKHFVCNPELDNEEVHDGDMAEDELALYIKTPQEIAFALQSGLY